MCLGKSSGGKTVTNEFWIAYSMSEKSHILTSILAASPHPWELYLGSWDQCLPLEHDYMDWLWGSNWSQDKTQFHLEDSVSQQMKIQSANKGCWYRCILHPLFKKLLEYLKAQVALSGKVIFNTGKWICLG